MKVLVYDFETTDYGKICAFGGLQYDTVTTECIEFSHYVQVVGAVGWRTTKIHGITEAQCRGGMAPSDAIAMLWRLTKESDVIVVHNFSCEANCLAKHLPRDADLQKFLDRGYFDTYRFARSHGYREVGLESLFMQIYREDHGYGDAHDPLVDARITADIFHYFLEKYGEDAIRRSVIQPKISRICGVTYDYRKEKWKYLNRKFPNRESAEAYALQCDDAGKIRPPRPGT